MKYSFKYWNYFEQRITIKWPLTFLKHSVTRQRKKWLLAEFAKKLKKHFRLYNRYFLKEIIFTTHDVFIHVYGYSLKGFIAGSHFGGFQSSQDTHRKILRYVQHQF